MTKSKYSNGGEHHEVGADRGGLPKPSPPAPPPSCFWFIFALTQHNYVQFLKNKSSVAFPPVFKISMRLNLVQIEQFEN